MIDVHFNWKKTKLRIYLDKIAHLTILDIDQVLLFTDRNNNVEHTKTRNATLIASLMASLKANTSVTGFMAFCTPEGEIAPEA